jgi:hypothetical protein
MKTARIGFLLAALVVVSAAAYARELGHPVQKRDGKNVVARTGEVLDFRLAAEREANGSILVRVTVPASSTLQEASFLRLEIRKGGKILLWSGLATRKEPDGSIQAGFQIDESLAGEAFVSFVYNGAEGDRGGMWAYQVPLAQYVTDKWFIVTPDGSLAHGWHRRDASLPQDLLHRLSLRQLVDELVEVADLSHQRVFNVFHAHAAHNALDQRAVRMDPGRLGEEGLEVALPFDLPPQPRPVVTRQPADDLIDFFLRAVLAFRLLDVQRVHLREFHRENAVVRHRHCPCGSWLQ